MKEMAKVYGSYYNGRWDTGMSQIWEVLLRDIHLVDNYKADLIHDIISITDAIKVAGGETWHRSDEKDGTIVRWFGFRDNGVDHYEYIMSNIFGSTDPSSVVFVKERLNMALYEYRRMYRLEMTIDAKSASMTCTLAKSDANEFYKEYKPWD